MITIDLNKKVIVKMRVDFQNLIQKEEGWTLINNRGQDQKDINIKRIQYKMEQTVYRNSTMTKILD
jgi:hypothetical protein